uniref:Transmembrane O-mannosyltransferase targeting cadherins 1 n=1 Tax=Molossus molossus TaxID=27622 RepID=A0A7J8G2G6_MOLMO|nr:transmembrane O-mannosyltransferase targeting cadherins 1 [Molossus molossus]
MMGQTKEAEKMTSHIVSEETGCLECYRLLSAIYSQQEQHRKALDAIDKALELKPKDPKVISELFFTKGNQLREQNLLDKAFESYKAAVELNPDQAQAWMNMGGIQHIKVGGTMCPHELIMSEPYSWFQTASCCRKISPNWIA